MSKAAKKAAARKAHPNPTRPVYYAPQDDQSVKIGWTVENPGSNKGPKYVLTREYVKITGSMNATDKFERKEILDDINTVTIAYGSRCNHIVLAEFVSMAMLAYYVPHLNPFRYAEFSATTEPTIFLPNEGSYGLIGPHGLKFVLNSMKSELLSGSASYNGKRYTMRTWNCEPRIMLHSVPVLRAFGMLEDAEMLMSVDGPIVKALNRKAHEVQDLRDLENLLHNLELDPLIDAGDKWVADGAREIYKERCVAVARSTVPFESLVTDNEELHKKSSQEER